MPDLRVRIGSATFPNPVFVAAGTFGYGVEFAKAVRLDRLGALITKTLTREPREGHPPPRLVETPSGMLNAVGLQNVGLEAFLHGKLPQLSTLGVPVIVSVLGESLGEIQALCSRLGQHAAVAAIELNLSCPNLTGRHAPDNRRRFDMIAQDPEATADVVTCAKQSTTKPIIAKLSPDVTDIRVIAQAAVRAGADAVSIGNTFVGMSLDPMTRRSRLGALTGGLSGPAIRPLALYRVWYTARSVSVPVIGLGGIVRAGDAIEFFLAGASAAAIGTANFADPRAPIRVLRGLERYLAAHHLESIEALRQSADPSVRGGSTP